MRVQDDERDELRELVLRATRGFVGIAARSLAEISDEVTLAQYRVLVLIDGLGPQTMGDLASSLGVNPSTVTRVCDVLVDKSLIRRRADDANRRTVLAELTRSGRRLVRQVMDRRRRMIDDALDRMAPASQRRLALALHEFAVAAGEVSDDAWTLGWPIDTPD